MLCQLMAVFVNHVAKDPPCVEGLQGSCSIGQAGWPNRDEFTYDQFKVKLSSFGNQWPEYQPDTQFRT
jgi:hypothetical protein